jgi:hypothetical protein
MYGIPPYGFGASSLGVMLFFSTSEHDVRNVISLLGLTLHGVSLCRVPRRAFFVALWQDLQENTP